MASLSDYDVPELAAELARAGCGPGHAGRLLRNYYHHNGCLWLSELKTGKRIEAFVSAHLSDRKSTVLSRAISTDLTTKLLVGFTAGGAAEAVLMPGYRPDRAAGCISSQIGCAMGCDFCASTRGGLERNLSAGEIVEQFLHLRALAASMNRRLASLVFMGMGEPLLNLVNVINAIKRIAGPLTGGLGARQITVSTVGIVPGIDALADADLNVNLALSLHAPDDALRGRLVPINRKYPISSILAAARRFAERTGRIVTIEYCLLAGVNDSDDHARRLADLLHDFRAHVNLIPHNPIGMGLSGTIYRRPPPERIASFLAVLRAANVVAHARDARGDDVNAACGQLRQTSLPPEIRTSNSR